MFAVSEIQFRSLRLANSLYPALTVLGSAESKHVLRRGALRGVGLRSDCGQIREEIGSDVR